RTSRQARRLERLEVLARATCQTRVLEGVAQQRAAAARRGAHQVRARGGHLRLVGSGQDVFRSDAHDDSAPTIVRGSLGESWSGSLISAPGGGLGSPCSSGSSVSCIHACRRSLSSRITSAHASCPAMSWASAGSKARSYSCSAGTSRSRQPRLTSKSLLGESSQLHSTGRSRSAKRRMYF